MIKLLFIWSTAVSTILMLIYQTEGKEVKIYRDRWGVPHIYADTAADVAYGLGYAQAEDRLEAVLKNYLTATGQMSEVFGPDYIDSDFQQLLWEHERMARKQYAKLNKEVRKILRYFVDGMITYLQENPHKQPTWAFDPQPYHVLAFGRYLTWQTLEQQANQDFQRKSNPINHSNLWIIGPEYSVGDRVILCFDPHRNWNDSHRWYEAHLHGGTIHAFGFAYPGLPVFSVGHTDRLGWGTAPGGPDGADVYEIKLESPASLRYRYGNDWKLIKRDTLRIDVNFDGKRKTYLRPIQKTHYGPILHRQDFRAYAYRLALQDNTSQVEQLYRQMTSRNLEEFYHSLTLAQTGPQRLIYGDIDGNIFYIQTGLVPIRQESYKYDRPLPGNTLDTEWQGIHAHEDLVQTYNPPQGWIQDCGASPDLVMPYSPLVPNRYPDYIFNHIPGIESPRSTRTRQVLSANSRMSIQESFDLALDTYVSQTEHWQQALTEAYLSDQSAKSDLLDKAINLITNWNGRADQKEVGITLYAKWREICKQKGRAINVKHIISRQKLGDKTRKAILEALEQAAVEINSRYGKLNIPWKEVNRLRRGNRTWGISGSSGDGLEALRTVVTSPDRTTNFGISGQSCTTVIIFYPQDKVESFSATPYGQSDDPNSLNSWNQAENLFSKDRLKPNTFQKAGDPLGHDLKLYHNLKIPDHNKLNPQ